MHAEKIIQIRPIGKQRTVDITVKSDNHVFYGNGIVGSNSHAYAYGEIAIWTAFAKAHFPQEFYCSYLRHAKDKEKVSILVNDAKRAELDVYIPSILKVEKNFELDKLAIRFGVGNIERIGEKNAEHLLEQIRRLESERNKKIEDWSWYEILIYLTPTVSKTMIQNMIVTGCFAYLKQYRKYLLFEYLKFLDLKDNDIVFLQNSNTSSLREGLIKLIDAIKVVNNGKTESLQLDLARYGLVGKISSKNGLLRYTDKHLAKLKDIVNILTNPPKDLVDTEEWIDNNEKKMLGIQITCMKIDTCDRTFSNCLCADFKNSDMKEFRIAAQLNKVSEYVPKQGKLAGETMAYLVLSDNTGSCESVAFPNKYEEFKHLLFVGNTVGITGRKSSSGGLQIDKVIQL